MESFRWLPPKTSVSTPDENRGSSEDGKVVGFKGHHRFLPGDTIQRVLAEKKLPEAAR